MCGISQTFLLHYLKLPSNSNPRMVCACVYIISHWQIAYNLNFQKMLCIMFPSKTFFIPSPGKLKNFLSSVFPPPTA